MRVTGRPTPFDISWPTIFELRHGDADKTVARKLLGSGSGQYDVFSVWLSDKTGQNAANSPFYFIDNPTGPSDDGQGDGNQATYSCPTSPQDGHPNYLGCIPTRQCVTEISISGSGKILFIVG